MINKWKGFSFDNYIRYEFISGMFLFVNNIEFYKVNFFSLFVVFFYYKMFISDLFKWNLNVWYKVD